jgi:hypothetical protein
VEITTDSIGLNSVAVAFAFIGVVKVKWKELKSVSVREQKALKNPEKIEL